MLPLLNILTNMKSAFFVFNYMNVSGEIWMHIHPGAAFGHFSFSDSI